MNIFGVLKSANMWQQFYDFINQDIVTDKVLLAIVIISSDDN